MAQPKRQPNKVLSTILIYLIWLASAALSLWLILQMRLLFLVDLPLRSQNVDPWALGAIDKFGFVAFGIVYLVFLVVTEEIFRRMVSRGIKLRTIAWLFGVEGGLLGLVYLWRLLL
ncbi:MAG: hypothetical protein JXC32_11090 [Anaerolineae bacterium]|nr:hypothetical protein [Anaerolineae bacterium]